LELKGLFSGSYVFAGVELDRRNRSEAKSIAANAWLFALGAVFAFFRVTQLHAYKFLH